MKETRQDKYHKQLKNFGKNGHFKNTQNAPIILGVQDKMIEPNYHDTMFCENSQLSLQCGQGKQNH